jgi:hypothetical protein
MRNCFAILWCFLIVVSIQQPAQSADPEYDTVASRSTSLKQLPIALQQTDVTLAQREDVVAPKETKRSNPRFALPEEFWQPAQPEEPKKTCTPQNAFGSLRHIVEFDRAAYDIPQCKASMERNILMFSACLMLLLWSYQLSEMSNVFPDIADDNTITEIARAAGRLTITPFVTALFSYFMLTTLLASIIDFAGSSDPNTQSNLFLASGLLYYMQMSDNLFMLMMICAFGLSVTALYKIGLIQAHLGTQTSTSSKIITIIQPSLSCCASVLTISKTGFFML